MLVPGTKRQRQHPLQNLENIPFRHITQTHQCLPDGFPGLSLLHQGGLNLLGGQFSGLPKKLPQRLFLCFHRRYEPFTIFRLFRTMSLPGSRANAFSQFSTAWDFKPFFK